jgi:hypothetical protein
VGCWPSQTDQPHLIDGAPGLRHVWAVDPHLAVRPDGHCLPPGQRPDYGLVRRGDQALWGVGGHLPGPARHRKGVVEKSNHTAAQRWWRTLADDTTPEQAQASVDRWARCAATPAYGRPATARPPSPPSLPPSHWPRCRRRSRPSWPCGGSPARRPWSPSAATATRYARAGPCPGHGDPPARRAAHRAGQRQRAHRRDRHRPPPARPGRGQRHRPRHRTRPRSGTRRLSAFTTATPHRRKQRIPPGSAARAAAAALRTSGSDAPAPSTPDTPTSTAVSEVSAEVVVDLARYAAAAEGRNTLPGDRTAPGRHRRAGRSAGRTTAPPGS